MFRRACALASKRLNKRVSLGAHADEFFNDLFLQITAPVPPPRERQNEQFANARAFQTFVATTPLLPLDPDPSPLLRADPLPAEPTPLLTADATAGQPGPLLAADPLASEQVLGSETPEPEAIAAVTPDMPPETSSQVVPVACGCPSSQSADAAHNVRQVEHLIQTVGYPRSGGNHWYKKGWGSGDLTLLQ